MGQEREESLRVDFDRSVKVEFHGANVTSEAGLLALRELDDTLGLTDMMADVLVDTRTGLNTRHTLLAQLRQSVHSHLAGFEDTKDAEQLCQDPTIRQVVAERAKVHKAASSSQIGRFETDVLTQHKSGAVPSEWMWVGLIYGSRSRFSFFIGFRRLSRSTYFLIIFLLV